MAMDRNPEWYLDEEFWRTFYPCMFNEETFRRGREEAAALARLAGIESGRVLDLGAGPGRHALPLADSGYSVTALDTSGWLLGRLEEQAGQAGLEIEIVTDDMRSFRRQGSFDLVLVLWTSFGYFSDPADHLRVLENVRDSLVPGGRVVLDLVSREHVAHTLQPVHLTEFEDGAVLVERPLLVDEMSRLDNEWLYIVQDRVHRAHFSHHLWSTGEIRRLLADAGLDCLGLFGSVEGDELELESERMVALAAAG